MDEHIKTQVQYVTPWMQSFTGRRLDLIADDLVFDNVRLIDVAHGLSLINRWNGATRYPLPVAQHSLIVSKVMQVEYGRYAREGLMHDCIEYIVGDIISPVKSLLKDSHDKYVGPLEEKLAGIFGLEYPWPKEIHGVDLRVAATEHLHLMAPDTSPEKWVKRLGEPYVDAYVGALIYERNWRDVKEEFIQRYEQLTGVEIERT